MLNLDKVRPTFICGHRKSGTTLLVALLDFHPQLLVYPDDSKFFHLFYPAMDNANISPEEKILSIVNKNFDYLGKVLFEKCNATKEYINFDILIDKFRLYAAKDTGWQHMLKSMITAFAEVTPQNLDEVKRWVEKTTSSEIFALEINEAFPSSKFIHIIRDPRDNYASLKSGWQKRYRHLADSSTLEALRHSCIERGRLGMKMGQLNQKVLSDKQYMIVRYEDLVLETEKTLNEVSDFLSIDPARINLTPTACGLPWKGNNMENKVFNSPSSVNVGKWRERIEEEEAALMEFHFKDVMQSYGYQQDFSYSQQLKAANEHYKWHNFYRKKSVKV